MAYRIIQDRCTACLACLAECPLNAIHLGKDSKVSINQDECNSCGACVPECDYEAIEEIDE